MRKKRLFIPVNAIANEFGTGISIERNSFNEADFVDNTNSNDTGNSNLTHRHDGHSFFLLEKGSITLQIDFQKYTITAPSAIYVHPNQVHRTLFIDEITVSSLSIINENLHPEHLPILEDLTPAKPLVLLPETFLILSEAFSFCLKLAQRKTDKLHRSFLKDGCNTLVGLYISQYLAESKPVDKFSRSEMVTKNFLEMLARNYRTANRPKDYAQNLHLSTSYLNECVKNTTGHPVSYHIRQRIILEAKRLLYHSDKSVKEIAAALGYDDYPYFSRIFTKATSLTATSFRKKNRE